MNRILKILFLIAILILGTWCLNAISPFVTFLAVSLTGWAWLTWGLRLIMIAGFWGLLIWKFWPRKPMK